MKNSLKISLNNIIHKRGGTIKMEDKKWEEIIELAEENGFLINAYGGVALLATPEEQEKAEEAKNGKH